MSVYRINRFVTGETRHKEEALTSGIYLRLEGLENVRRIILYPFGKIIITQYCGNLVLLFSLM